MHYYLLLLSSMHLTGADFQQWLTLGNFYQTKHNFTAVKRSSCNFKSSVVGLGRPSLVKRRD